MVDVKEVCARAKRIMTARETLSADTYGIQKAMRLLDERDRLIADLLSALATPEGEPVAWASSKEWRKNQLMSAAQYNSALPKNRTDFDIPLFAALRSDSGGET